MIVVAILLTLGVVVASAYLLAFLDVFFTFVPKNQIKAVMAGEELLHLLVNVDGYRRNTDSSGNLVRVRPKSKDPKRRSDGKSWLNKRLGIYFVGFWPLQTVLHYRFTWNKSDKKGEETEYTITPRDEMVGSIFHRYQYGIPISKVEIAGNLQVEFLVVATIEATNPRKMLFGILPSGMWLSAVTVALKESVLLFASNKSINELRALKDSNNPSAAEFVEALMKVNEKGEGANPSLSIEKEFGARVVAINFGGVEQEGGTEIRQATQAAEMARLKGEGIVAAADAQRKADTLLGQGEGARAKSRGEGEADALLAQMIAVGSNGSTLVAIKKADAVANTKVQVYAPADTGDRGVSLMVNTPSPSSTTTPAP